MKPLSIALLLALIWLPIIANAQEYRFFDIIGMSYRNNSLAIDDMLPYRKIVWNNANEILMDFPEELEDPTQIFGKLPPPPEDTRLPLPPGELLPYTALLQFSNQQTILLRIAVLNEAGEEMKVAHPFQRIEAGDHQWAETIMLPAGNWRFVAKTDEVLQTGELVLRK